MPVYRDYEIRLNLNELIEHRIPTCDLLHPDHCLTESQVADIAHDINMDLDLHPIFHQIDDHIMRYVKAAGIDNKDNWVEKKLTLRDTKKKLYDCQISTLPFYDPLKKIPRGKA